MPRRSVLWSVVAAASLPLAVVVPNTARSDETLYVRLGGEAKLAAIVDAYVDRLSADPRTRRSFEGANLKRVKRMLAEQLCDLAGGPCEYTGDSMRDVHAGHGIDDGEFLRGVEMLREVLRDHNVGLRERNELLSILAPMKRDVVDSAPSRSQ